MVIKGLGALGSFFNRPGMDGWSGGGAALSEPMRQSAYVMRAIKRVSGPIAAVPLQFSLDEDGKQMVSDPALSAFWKEPAQDLGYADFVEANVGWLKLEGEFFWVLDDTWLPSVAGSKLPFPEAGRTARSFAPLIVARPDRMREMVERETGRLSGWEFTDGAGRKHALLREQVVQCKFWNPYNPHRGLPEYEAARVAAEADYFAGLYGRNLMRNNGDRGPIIVGKDGAPDEPQQKQIIEALREKRELAQQGIFKTIFLGGNISVEDPKAQALDAGMMAQRVGNQEEIFLALGVPPSMAHKQASYSIGSASDWYQLIFDTCTPTAEKLEGKIAKLSSQMTGKELFASHRWGDHPVVQAVRKESLESGVKIWATGMPWESINEFLGLEMPAFKGWDKGYLPFGLAEVGSEELRSPEVSPRYNEEDSTEGREDREGKEANPTKAITELRALFTKGAGGSFQTKRSRRDLANWRDAMAKRRPIEKAYQSKFNKALFAARAEVLAKLSRASATSEKIEKAAAADFMFSLEKFTEGILVGFRKTAEIALQTAGEELFEELAKDDPWKTPPAEVIRFVQERENKLTDVTQGVFEDIKGVIQEGFDKGDTMKEIADAVRSQCNEMSEERALRIAMTETSAAYGVGRQKAMEEAGITHKKWLTSGNDNVRPAHAHANGQVVEIDEAFEVGGESLMHPGDPSGSPGNVINCHCVSIPVVAPG